jgi:hypothetical protein
MDELLCATAGLFARRAEAQVDGATLQRRLRSEWDEAPVRSTRPAGPARRSPK